MEGMQNMFICYSQKRFPCSMWGICKQIKLSKSSDFLRDSNICVKNAFVYLCRIILRDSGFFRYLHTAVVVSGTMLVFGGNTHNDTSMSHGAKCFSSDFMAYNLGQCRTDTHTTSACTVDFSQPLFCWACIIFFLHWAALHSYSQSHTHRHTGALLSTTTVFCCCTLSSNRRSNVATWCTWAVNYSTHS